MPYIKNKIRVNVPKRSGFDKSHRNSGTGFCGTLLPLLCDEIIPNTRVSLRINLATQLPPLVSDTYMNVKQKVEAFFVPGRLLCKSYEPWFCDRADRSFFANSGTDKQQSGTFFNTKPAVPVLALSAAANPNFAKAGTLADYLGFTGAIPTAGISISMLPFIAYHLIWQEYYRNPQVQNPAFVHSLGIGHEFQAASIPRIACILDQYFNYADGTLSNDYVFTLDSTNADSFKCADGVSIFDLRQRNFGLDYFTGARPSAQMGSAAAVSLAIPAGTDAAGGTTSFTVQQLRAANSLQQFRERNNLPGTRLVEQVKARYGANLSDGVAQRPICIGSATYDYGSRGVSQTGAWTGSPNIFNGVAAEYGRAYSAGSDFIIEDFTANEPGYIIVLTSMVPEVSYTFGLDPLFTRYTAPGCIVNMANPLLQNVGDQPILCSEISPTASIGQVFGYQDRFADFMFKRNSIHGNFNSNSGSMGNFVLQRAINGTPTLGTSFLEIPKTYLDGVVQVNSTAADCSYWYDCMLDYKVSMPLAEFSIPSLQDPAYEHGQSVSLRRNGQIF